MSKILPYKDFSKFKSLITHFDLNEIQLKSYHWLLEQGMREILEEVSPIRDHTGKEIELYFEDYRFDKPKVDEVTASYKEATYEMPLYIRVRLEHKKTGRSTTQEIYFGDFPMMTSRGTFIINGVERVVISQLIRSPGVYFSAVPWRDRQLFGAKIIPNRGAWLEFETDSDGSIVVKIDRNRKVPATNLLRIFGATEETFSTAFQDIDRGQIQHLEATLKKDTAKSIDGSYLEIYRRLRPGDPATPATAKTLVDSIFQRFERYDLSPVGRFKLNQRLGLEKKEKDGRLLDLEDLTAIIREIIRLNNSAEAKPDDIDHLGNRRLKSVGELLQGRLRVGLARLRRIVQDRMSTLDRETLMLSQLINFRPISAVVKEFFASSQLSQFMDQVNPLAELEHKRRLSALGPGGLRREHAGFEVRDVHHSHYGRICPILTPEGTNIGLINYLAGFARTNEFGFLETPYAKVNRGRPTDEIVWLNALDEEKYRIVHAAMPRKDGRLAGGIVEVRFKGEVGTCSVGEVDLIEVAPHQFVSIATSLIPFLQHTEAARALMGSNMQRQAVPSIKPQAPYVMTGQEEKTARNSGYVIRAEADGKIIEVDAGHIAAHYGKETKTYPLAKFKRSNQYTCIFQKPLVALGQTVKKGDLLADSSSTDNGVLALGQNLVVAFMSWEGANFEDAIILSERVARDDLFTSIHIEDFYHDVRDTKLGPEMTTPDLPNVSEEKLKNLDEEGIVRIGAEVKTGDILVGKISPKGETELTAEERLLHVIFGEKARDVKDTSLTVSHGKRGRVVGVKVFSRDQGDKLEVGVIKRIQVEVANLRKVQAGDKLAGRHGNKGVISQVRPVEDMPYLEDGTPVDIILNPLGVVSRMNLGQILETHLGAAVSKTGYRAITPGLDSASEEEIRNELKKAGLPEDGKRELFDGRTGQPFDQRVTVGVIYMMKLNHLVEDKVHMRSIGPYSLITQQPLGGKAQFGGQRFGEMEVWALEAYGARHTLQEMLTIKSDDVLGRSAAYESIIRGESIKEPNIPATFNVLVNELKALSLNIEPMYDSVSSRRDDFKAIKISAASPENILEWSHGEVTKPETINYRTQRPEKDGLFSERIFGPVKDYECYCGKYRRIRYKDVICDRCGVEVTRASVRRERIGHITLATPVAHIWFFKAIPSRLSLIIDVPSSKLERVIYYVDYMVTGVDEDGRKAALAELERELKQKLKLFKKSDKKAMGELTAAAHQAKSFLEKLRPGQVLSEAEYLNLSKRFGNIFTAGSGAESVRKVLEIMDLKSEIQKIEKTSRSAKETMAEAKVLRRLKTLRTMLKSNIRPEHLILTVLPVLPPDLRPMVALDGGRYATSDLNDLYRRVINRNNRLNRLLEIKAPEVIVKNEKRMLQEAVDALIDNSARLGVQQLSAQRRPLRSLTDMLKGKQGRFRQNLLGKRVDYSGRSVIVVGPKLKLDQCGLPKKIALELFRPFVIHEVIKRGMAHTIRSANRLIEQAGDEIHAILEEIIKERRVLLNRAPTLHRLGIQSFKPTLIEGLAIQIPPLVCAAFNADFDGDQMAIHLPLSEEAQVEAEEIMAARRNILKPATGDLVATPTNDIVLGVYYLTWLNPNGKGKGKSFSSLDEALMAYENDQISLHAPIRLGSEEITLGRLLFSQALDGTPAPILKNETFNKKKLARCIETLVEQYGLEYGTQVLDRIKNIGFEMATRSGITWAMADLAIPKEKKEILKKAEGEIGVIREQYQQGLLTDSERKTRVIGIWENAKTEITKFVASTFSPGNPIYQIIDSGSRGSWAQPIQMMGMKGLVQNPRGETLELPIKSSFKEGFNVLEYFISTRGARKGMTDTALKTAQAGYLTRRLVDVSQELTIKEEDCRTTEGIEVFLKDAKEIGQSMESLLFSRTAAEDIKSASKIIVRAGEIIDKKAVALIQESKIESVKMHSPITCKTLYGICRRCYGLDLNKNQLIGIGEAIGVVAAQSIGEPGTQLTLRTFHIGGIAGFDITHGLPRVEELFEARAPKGKAVLVSVDGKIEKIDQKGALKIITVKAKEKKGAGRAGKKKTQKAIEYMVPRSALLFVETGDAVEAGQQLSEGHLDLHELLGYKGSKEVIRYILNGVQKIYSAEGASINNKHIEIMIRQMFSRVKIKDGGDAPDLVMGETIDKSKFLEINRELKKQDKQPARAQQLLLGVTRVALSTDSFLSAASFQDTSRVLVQASLEGRIDPLRGLKENVIIGRLVPVGKNIKKAEMAPYKKELPAVTAVSSETADE